MMMAASFSLFAFAAKAIAVFPFFPHLQCDSLLSKSQSGREPSKNKQFHRGFGYSHSNIPAEAQCPLLQ